ncbi:MAG: sulfotransferase [Proteobacteria bacterium]|nr:sulfotransferase [Pseudomonadota bacterium]
MSFVASEDAILDGARTATGLDDFGDGPWRDHFRTLLRAYDAESRLTEAGRQMVLGEIGGVLAARLTCEAAWKRDPKILGNEIRRPIFILGLPRSGTTALHFLLGQDPANQALEYWLAAAPRPRPPRATWENEPAFQTAATTIEWIYQTDPSLRAIHLLEADGPEECRHLLLQSFLDHTFDSNATIPSYTKYFEAQDMRPAYERHRDVLKLIGSPTPERRWVLKYPAHMRELDVLLAVYPDACIVQTHRDPVKVLPSVCSLVTGWRSLYEGSADAKAIGAWQLEMYASMIEHAMDVRARSNPAQFYDFSFRELVSDPVAAIRRMYEYFGFAPSPDGEPRMRAWHESHPQHKHGGHRYTLLQFGLKEEAIRGRFARYTDRFDVEAESAG